MKKRLLVSLFALLVGASTFGLASCQPKEKTAAELFAEAKANISTVLESSDRSAASVEGTVYQTTSTGYFIEDSTGVCFVADANNTVAIGDLVDVSGRYRATSTAYYIQVTKTDYFATVSTGNTAKTATESTVKDVAELANTKANYGKYVTVVGTLAKDSSVYTLKDLDKNTIYINDVKNATAFDAYDGKRIKVSVVTESYNAANSTWNCGFDGNNVDEEPLTIEEIKEFVTKKLDEVMPTEICGKMNGLPLTYDVGGESVALTWKVYEIVDTVVSTDAATTVTVDAETGAVAVTFEETDHEYQFVATAVVNENAEKTFEVKYTVKSAAVVEKSIKSIVDAYNDETSLYKRIPYSYVKFSGVIIGKLQNQGQTLYGLAIRDQENTSYSLQADVSAADFAAYNVGDVVTVVGQFRTVSDDRVTVLVYSGGQVANASVEKTSTTTVTYTDADCSLIVDSEEDLIELATNWNAKYVGTLVKFVNPNTVWGVSGASKITSKSSVCVTYGTSANDYKYALNGGNNLTPIGLLNGANCTVLGNSYWYGEYFNVGYSGQNDALVAYGADFYAIPTYYTVGTFAALIMPTNDCLVPVDATTAFKLSMLHEFGEATDFSAEDPYAINLPVTYGETAIAWTCEDTTNVTIATESVEGYYPVTLNSELTADTKVVFKATMGETVIDIEYTIYANTPKTVSELAAKDSGASNLKVNGYVVGFASQHGGTVVSTSSTTYGSTGLLISDGTKVMTLTQCTGLSVTKATGVWTLNETEVKVGDYVELGGVRVTAAGISCTANTMTINNTVEGYKAIDHDFVNLDDTAITISSDAELEAYVGTLVSKTTQSMQVIKLVGTEDNPIYLGSSGTSYTVSFYFLSEGESATDVSKVTQYVTSGAQNASRLFVIPMEAQGAWGTEWMIVNTPVTGFDSTYQYGSRSVKVSDTTPAYAYTGSLYVVLEYVSSDVYFSTVFGTFDATPVGEADRVKSFVTAGFPATVDSNADYTFTVPSLECIEITGISSSNTELLNVTGTEGATVKAGECSVDTEVTLTIDYKYNGVAGQTTKAVTVNKAATRVWTLVDSTNISKLVADTKILIVAKSGDKYYAFEATSTTSKDTLPRSAVEITFGEDCQPVLPESYKGVYISAPADGDGECGIATFGTNKSGACNYIFPNSEKNALTGQASHTATTDWKITADTTGINILGASRAAYITFASGNFTVSTTNDYSVSLYAFIA